MSEFDAATQAGDAVELIATDKDGKVTHKIIAGFSGMVTAPKNLHFCSDCGERLLEIPLFICETCGQRYVARLEPKTGKTVIFALGNKDSDLLREEKRK